MLYLSCIFSGKKGFCSKIVAYNKEQSSHGIGRYPGKEDHIIFWLETSLPCGMLQKVWFGFWLIAMLSSHFCHAGIAITWDHIVVKECGWANRAGDLFLPLQASLWSVVMWSIIDLHLVFRLNERGTEEGRQEEGRKHLQMRWDSC